MIMTGTMSESNHGLEALLNNVNFDSSNAILKVFDEFGKDLTIDRKWLLSLERYVHHFMTKRVGEVDYAEFFGSPYLGLQKVVFTNTDLNLWFTEIFDVDYDDLKENLHKCSGVNPNFSVTSDVFNLTVPYLLYRIFHSKLNHNEKNKGMELVLIMYHCKCITGIISHDYKYNARKEVAYETYKLLSLKYDIKKYGSWRKLFEARAKFIINPTTGIHYNTFTKMDNDLKIIYMVGDIQDRLRGVINDINKVFHDVKNKVNIVKINSATVTLNDEVNFKDSAKDISLYKTYITNALSSGNSFIKSELIGYASDALEHSQVNKLERVLKHFVEAYNASKGVTIKYKGGKQDDAYKWFVDEIITNLFEYTSSQSIPLGNLKEVIVRMRGSYQSTRSMSTTLIKLRDVGDTMVKEATGIKTPIVVSSLRTSLMIYIVIRTLTRDYFS